MGAGSKARSRLLLEHPGMLLKELALDLEKIKLYTAPVIEKLGYEVVDVECVQKHGGTQLTFFIACDGSITFDDCEKVHLAIDPVLDELNPSRDAPYILNVSSPGLDRPFKTRRDYERNYGKKVEIKLYAPYRGKKVYEGILIEKTEHAVAIGIGEERMQFEDSKVVFVRPYVSFE